MSTSSFDDWLVQVPLHTLVALQELPARMDVLEKSQNQLRRELDALHAICFQLMEKLGESKR